MAGEVKNQHQFDRRGLSFSLGSGTTTFGSGYIAVSAGDVDNDGKKDLVAVSSGVNSAAILIGNGLGGFDNPSNFAVAANPITVIFTDLNNDNNLDIVTVTPSNYYYGSNTISVLLGNGAGAFGGVNNFNLSAKPASIAVGDFNGDGNLDIVTANQTSNNLSILLGDGTGALEAAKNFAINGQPISIAVGDFNNDGNLDVVAANSYSNNVSVLLGDGTGNFEEANSLNVNANPISVAVGDFNNDGNLDIVTANSSSNNVSVLLGDGAGNFEEANNFNVGDNPVSVAISDFDGDGNLDVATANSVTSNASVLLGDGAGSLKKANNFAITSTPAAMVVADINQDGRDDIVIAGKYSTGFSRISTLINRSQASSLSMTALPRATMTQKSTLVSKSAASSLPMSTSSFSSLSLTPKRTHNKPTSLPTNSTDSTTVCLSRGTLGLLISAPIGGLLLLILVLGLFMYKRYQNKYSLEETQDKDIPMLPMKKNDSGRAGLLNNAEQVSGFSDDEDSLAHIKLDSALDQEQVTAEKFAKKQQFFKSSSAEPVSTIVQKLTV